MEKLVPGIGNSVFITDAPPLLIPPFVSAIIGDITVVSP
jgi:hypothetical protein